MNVAVLVWLVYSHSRGGSTVLEIGLTVVVWNEAVHGNGGVDLAGILGDAGANPGGFWGEWWGIGTGTSFHRKSRLERGPSALPEKNEFFT